MRYHPAKRPRRYTDPPGYRVDDTLPNCIYLTPTSPERWTPPEITDLLILPLHYYHNYYYSYYHIPTDMSQSPGAPHAMELDDHSTNPATNRNDGESTDHNPQPPTPEPIFTSAFDDDPVDVLAAPETVSAESKVWASWSFKIHNIDNNTPISAQNVAKKIIAHLPIIHLPPPPFSDTTDPVPVPRHLIRVKNADPTSNRFQSAAAIIFDPDDYEQGNVDVRALRGVMQALISQGHECEITSAPGNDRCTMLNYEINLKDSTTHPSTDFAKQTLAYLFESYGGSLANTWADTVRDRTMRGSCADHSPKRCRKLVEIGTFDTAEYIVIITQPRWIMPTHFTTMVLYIGDDSRRGTVEYTKEINNVVFAYNSETGGKSYVTTVRRSADDKFLLFDPSEPYLAQKFNGHVMTNGFFPRPLYEVNSSGANFIKTNILAHRDKIINARSTVAEHASTRTQVQAIGERITEVEHNADLRFSTLAHGTTDGFRILFDQMAEMRVEQLQEKLERTENALGDLHITHALLPEPDRVNKKQQLENTIIAVRHQIELRKTGTSALQLPALNSGPVFIPRAPGTYAKARGSPYARSSAPTMPRGPAVRGVSSSHVCHKHNDTNCTDLHPGHPNQQPLGLFIHLRSTVSHTHTQPLTTPPLTPAMISMSFCVCNCPTFSINTYSTSSKPPCPEPTSRPSYRLTGQPRRLATTANFPSKAMTIPLLPYIYLFPLVLCSLYALVETNHFAVILALLPLAYHFPRSKLSVILLLLLFCPSVEARDPTLTLLALNVNRLNATGSIKASNIIRLITKMAPAIFVLTETTIRDKAHVDLTAALGRLYNFFTTPASGANQSGGITIGVSCRIPSQHNVTTDEGLAHNVLEVTIQTPEYADAKQWISTKVIGVYAPQATDPAASRTLWGSLTSKLSDTRWIIAGDFNMILHEGEATAGHHLTPHLADNTNPYRTFLQTTGGADLWSYQEGHNAAEDFTMRREGQNTQAKSIIDRVAIGPAIPAGHIETLTDYVDRTDHRAIFSRIPIPLRGSGDWHTPPRILRLEKPPTSLDERYDTLRDNLHKELVANPNLSLPCTDDADFMSKYEQTVNIFSSACASSFVRPQMTVPLPHNPSKAERHLLHRLKIYKAAKAASNANRWQSWKSKADHLAREAIKPCAGQTPQDRLNTLEQLSTDASKQLRKLESERLLATATKRFDDKVKLAIDTGSIKKISPNQSIRIPPVVRDATNQGEIVENQEEYLNVWVSHFKRTFHRHPPQEKDKPWLRTPSSAHFQAQAKHTPLQWPVAMDANQLRDLLLKGNPKPAPGPDDWEKWALCHSGDEWLGVIANLANYIILNNHFPPAIQKNFIVPIYKKGDIIDPNNYRGIVLANTLQIITASWFTLHVTRYAWDMGFIPDTQIAAQAGARVGDMTHFLNALDGYARFTEKSILALKRDQQKGFDYLHHTGFQDAAKFFGIPQSVIDFDDARAKDVAIITRIQGMTGDQFLTQGLMKQGDPASPLKYVLTMAMAQWWISDQNKHMGIDLRTPLSLSTKMNHTANDDLAMRVNNVAAMDDTILLAETPEDLQVLTLCMEGFQERYNMVTEWEKPDKTTFFYLGVQPAHYNDRQITLTLPGGRVVTLQATEDRQFLRTPINDPKIHSSAVLRLAQEFIFPRPGRQLPITALRRIAHVTLGGRILAKIQQHPITSHTAKEIHTVLNVKIKQYYDEPFPASPEILTASIEQGGMDFPNIDKMNAIWSISFLHRCLNSANPTFNKAFAIMHSTFQCFGKKSHRCYLPFAPMQVTYASWNGTPKNNFLAWEIPRKYMIEMGLQLVPRHTINSGAEKQHTGRNDHSAKFEQKFQSYDLVWDQLEILVDEMEELEIDGHIVWATDGSADPPDEQGKGITALAIRGPVNFAARLQDGWATIQDAEVMAIAIAIQLDLLVRTRFGVPDEVPSKLYSDHLNTVRRMTGPISTFKITPQLTSRHALRWLQDMMNNNPHIQLIHQKAHTEDKSLPAQMNREADEAAKQARFGNITTTIPDAYIDKYSLYSATSGISHGQIAQDVIRAYHSANPLKVKKTGNVYKYQPKYLYTRAQKAFSAKTQLIIRSRQLPTLAMKTERNFGVTFDTCQFCDTLAAEADIHHVFATCTGIQMILKEKVTITTDIVKRYEAREGIAWDKPSHLKLAMDLFTDSTWWHDDKTTYYMGELPESFPYHPELGPLYQSLTAVCIKTAGHIWGKHIRTHSTNQHQTTARAT